MTLWEHLENLTYHKRKWDKLSEEEKKTINMFMINKFISMEYNYVDIVNEMQSLKLPDKYLYNLYISILPKQKKFFKFIKKSISEGDGDNIEIIRKISQVNEREAKDYIKNLTKDQLEEMKLQIEGVKTKKMKK